MLEFLFGVVVGILLLYLYSELKVNGTLSDEMKLTVAGYTLLVKKVDDDSGQSVQKGSKQDHRFAKSPKVDEHHGQKSKESSKSKQRKLHRDESSSQQEQQQEKAPSEEQNAGSSNGIAPANPNIVRTAQYKEDETPKSPSATAVGSAPFPGKSNPSMYLAPIMTNNRSKQLGVDVSTARFDSNEDLGGEQPQKSPRVDPAMTNSSHRLETARSASNADLGGKTKSPKSPNVAKSGKPAGSREQSMYLAPQMSKGESNRLNLGPARNSSQEDARR